MNMNFSEWSEPLFGVEIWKTVAKIWRLKYINNLSARNAKFNIKSGHIENVEHKFYTLSLIRARLPIDVRSVAYTKR